MEPDPHLDERIPSSPDLQIAVMEPDLVAVVASPLPPAASPTQQLQPQDDGERGALECADPTCPDRCAAGGDPNIAMLPSPVSAARQPSSQQPTGWDAAVNSEVEQEQEAAANCEVEQEKEAASNCEVKQEKEAAAVPGVGLRSFMEKFGDQGENPLILSPQLKGITTPDRHAALRFLGEKYNSLMERYKQQVAKCADECGPRYDGLKKKYIIECAERRRLYNELIELGGNIRLMCRCRPLSSDETNRGFLSVIEINPSQETELQVVLSKKERKAFKFDHVFGPEDDQEAVFSEAVHVVSPVMDGFNVCIFAYGQTGTGKTFTMEGVPENRGVNYRALEELFRVSEERRASVAYTFSVSILEVYNEKIRDLLDESNDPSKRLDVKSSDGTQEVPGLIEAPIDNIDAVWEKLKFSAQNRSVGATNANELSSRSHSLVRVTVRSEHLVTGQRSRSHMWLVDLAGSERLAKTGVEGDRLKESQFINKSLSALGDVISALASKKSHIPYRNSKLTHLLQSSLDGDCKTLMFVHISPSATDSGETLCTLSFASRVRAVEHGPVRKQVDPAESLKLKQMLEKLLRKEEKNAQLNQCSQSMQLKYASRENVFKTLNEKVKDAEQACKKYQQRVSRRFIFILIPKRLPVLVTVLLYLQIRELENELGNERKAARDSTRSSRPPLVPMRQRQPQGRSSKYAPPSGPSRSRFSEAPTLHNKENNHVTMKMKKAYPGADPNKAVGKARRVSLIPVIRQIPVQPKRRFSMAILPSLSEQLSVLNEKRAASQVPHAHVPRRSVAAFGSLLGAPLAGHGTIDATPDGAKLRRIGKARRVSLTPVIRQIPVQPKRRSSMAILPSLSEQLSVINEKRAACRVPHAHVPRRSVAAFGSLLGAPLAHGTIDATPDGAKFRRIDFGRSSKFISPPPNPMLGLWNKMATQQQKLGNSPAGGPGNTCRLCFSIKKRVAVSPVRVKPSVPSAMGNLNPGLREQVVVGRSGNALRVVNTKRRQSVMCSGSKDTNVWTFKRRWVP